MIERLKARGINDNRILQVMDEIPRHVFLQEDAVPEHVYEDKAFPIWAGQTISHPYTVAFQTLLLNPQKGEKVLEIGTGCGYQTAILAKLGAKVYSIERQRELNEKAKYHLSLFNLNARLVYGDGFKGLPAHAPYQKILVTCGAPYLPEELINQLDINGLMVIPIGEKEQIMTVIIKNADGSIIKEELGKFNFVPMLQEKQEANQKIFFKKT